VARWKESKRPNRALIPLSPLVSLQSKKRLMGYVSRKPANIGLRSQYALRLYSWAKKYVAVGTKRVPLSLEQLRKVLGLESVKDAAGNIIKEAPLPVWANLRQRALDVAISEINRKTDLNIAIESLERSLHRRVTSLIFAIKTQEVPEQSD
jgi:plasmid replication initiation protein